MRVPVEKPRKLMLLRVSAFSPLCGTLTSQPGKIYVSQHAPPNQGFAGPNASYIWYKYLYSIIWDRYQHLFSRPAQTMQEFMWQMDMRSVVLCVRGCLSVLLDAPVAGTADDDSDLTPSQP